MIMEQLVNGTPPTAIPANIASDASYLVPFLKVKVPTVDLCRRMRGELRIVTETLAAYRIAKAQNWRQLFTDGTSRRQTTLLTSIIAIDGPDGELVPIVLRGAFVATGETSEQQVADNTSSRRPCGARRRQADAAPRGLGGALPRHAP